MKLQPSLYSGLLDKMLAYACRSIEIP